MLMKYEDALMKTDVYYFSGTGNSLWVAQKISEKIEDSELISIPKVVNKKEGIKGEIIGIVCPIYMYTILLIVADFIKIVSFQLYLLPALLLGYKVAFLSIFMVKLKTKRKLDGVLMIFMFPYPILIVCKQVFFSE